MLIQAHMIKATKRMAAPTLFLNALMVLCLLQSLWVLALFLSSNVILSMCCKYRNVFSYSCCFYFIKRLPISDRSFDFLIFIVIGLNLLFYFHEQHPSNDTLIRPYSYEKIMILLTEKQFMK
ncbi:hypothetical protein C883_3406 [Bacillus stratosphericus LAMA 585]|nr:hypothetical protein C883_3406 [Bacillus stratosphericus LAMA 585]